MVANSILTWEFFYCQIPKSGNSESSDVTRSAEVVRTRVSQLQINRRRCPFPARFEESHHCALTRGNQK